MDYTYIIIIIFFNMSCFYNPGALDASKKITIFLIHCHKEKVAWTVFVQKGQKGKFDATKPICKIFKYIYIYTTCWNPTPTYI